MRRSLGSRVLAPVIGVLALAAGLVSMVPRAGAQVNPTTSTVALVHAIVGVDVDVYADGELVSDADGLAPTEALDLGAVAAGPLEAQVYAHVLAPPPTPGGRGDAVLITATLDVAAGIDLVVVAQARPAPSGAELTLTPFDNDLSPFPVDRPATRLSVRHVANAGPVDVWADGVRLVTGLASGQRSDVIADAGTTDIEVYAAGASPGRDLPVAGPIALDFAADTLTALYVAGDPDGTLPLTAFTTGARTIPSSVTLVHLIPGTPADVYVAADGAPDGPALVAAGVAPLSTVALPGGFSGTYDVVVYAAVANPAPLASGRGGPGDALVLDAPDVAIAGNLSQSLAVHLDLSGTAALALFVDDLSSTGVDNTRVSFRHTAAFGTAQGLDIDVGGAPYSSVLPGQQDFQQLLVAQTVAPGDIVVVPSGEDPDDPATPKVVNTAAVDLRAASLTAIYVVGSAAAGTLQLFVVTTPVATAVRPLTPVRIVDTRDGTGTGRARLRPGEVLRVSVNGQNSVPNTGAAAVALNVTAAEPSADGFLVVHPCSTPVPTVSNVNYEAGVVAVSNAVITTLNNESDFCVSTYAETDVVIDLTTWFSSAGGFAPFTPRRIADTRVVAPQGGPARPLQPGEVLVVDVVDPSVYDGAVVNVTAANTVAPGYLSVYPCADGVTPKTSSVNYEAGEAGAPNAVVTSLDEQGRVCVTSSGTVDVVVDLFTPILSTGPWSGGLFPSRLADTRDGTGGVPATPLVPGAVLTVQVGDPELEIDDVAVAVLNVTATNATADGYLTVYGCDASGPPYASSVNYSGAELATPNAVVTPVSASGAVCVTSYSPVDVVVDLTGYFSG